MSNDLLSLKWNNHNSTILEALKGFRNEGTHADATIVCEGNYYHVHKLVLSICSSYFNKIFKNNSHENPLIILNDVETKYIESLLDYIYMGETNVKQSDFSSFLELAESLQIKGLLFHQKSKNPKEKKVSVKRKSSSDVETECSPPSKKKYEDLPVEEFTPVTNNILDSTLANENILDSTLANGNILDSTLAAGNILDSTLATENILDSTLATGNILDSTIATGIDLNDKLTNTLDEIISNSEVPSKSSHLVDDSCSTSSKSAEESNIDKSDVNDIENDDSKDENGSMLKDLISKYHIVTSVQTNESHIACSNWLLPHGNEKLFCFLPTNEENKKEILLNFSSPEKTWEFCEVFYKMSFKLLEKAETELDKLNKSNLENSFTSNVDSISHETSINMVNEYLSQPHFLQDFVDDSFIHNIAAAEALKHNSTNEESEQNKSPAGGEELPEMKEFQLEKLKDILEFDVFMQRMEHDTQFRERVNSLVKYIIAPDLGKYIGNVFKVIGYPSMWENISLKGSGGRKRSFYDTPLYFEIAKNAYIKFEAEANKKSINDFITKALKRQAYIKGASKYNYFNLNNGISPFGMNSPW